MGNNSQHEAEEEPDINDFDEESPSSPHDVEQIDFGNNVRQKRQHGAVFTAIITVIIAVLVVGAAAGAWWMWQYKWRQVSVHVDDQEYQVRAGTTIAQFLADHHDFDRKSGRLVSVSGKVLEPQGGNPVTVKCDGELVPVDQYESATIANVNTMTVTPGTDKTEPYTIEERTATFGTDINLNNGPVQVVTQQGEDGVDEYWVGDISKEAVKKRAIKQAKKLTVQSFTPVPKNKKVIALTFDDGPSEYSGKILDILKNKKVHATFFDIGSQALEFPQLEQRMVKEGHQVASHSVDHAYLPKLSASALREEITTSFADLKEASGTVTRTMRAPYGAFGVQQWKDAATVLNRNVLWTVDTLDWKEPGAKAIHDEVMKNATNGAIVLMHDGGGDRTQDIQALPSIIDDLRKQGYSFVTIDELCAMSGVPQAAEPKAGSGSADTPSDAASSAASSAKSEAAR